MQCHVGGGGVIHRHGMNSYVFRSAWIDHGNSYLETAAEKVDAYKEGADKVGKFYFRWPQGECCADVHDRVCSFLETIYRKWQLPNRPENIVIITHSVVAQVFLMRWFHWDVETFDR
jgi:broad specificity phosphatase PhoE